MRIFGANGDLRALPLEPGQGWQEPGQGGDRPRVRECTLGWGFPVLLQRGLWSSVSTAWQAGFTRQNLGRA